MLLICDTKSTLPSLYIAEDEITLLYAEKLFPREFRTLKRRLVEETTTKRSGTNFPILALGFDLHGTSQNGCNLAERHHRPLWHGHARSVTNASISLSSNKTPCSRATIPFKISDGAL